MHQLNRAGGMDVADEIKEALRRQMGAARYELWFGHGVSLHADDDGITVTTDSLFAAERLRSRHISDVRSAAQSVCGSKVQVRVVHAEPDAESAVAESAAAEPAAVATSAVRAQNSAANIPGANIPGASTAGASASERSRMSNKPVPIKPSARGPRSLESSLSQHAALPARKARSASADADGQAADAPAQPAPTRWSMSLSHFIVGPCNELAHTATRMVVEQPGSASPVFFWGPSGTGKTHLLSAIRERLRRKHRLPRVIQLTAEDFTNDFTMALRGSGLPVFRRRYRDVDALLVDDVQFFGGNKRATLRELLHTVDALLRSGKQLVFAADRPPMEIEGIPAELAGRLSGGMMCSISPLDAQTRRLLLQQFAAMAGLILPDTLLVPLAETCSGDGRVLSGLVNQIRAFVQMRGKLPSWQQLLDSAAGDILRSSAPIIGLGDIQRAVCETFGLPTGTLQSRGQQRSVSQPRMLAMYLARQHTRAAYSEIGDYFGNRSHSTVIAATKRVAGWLNSEGQEAEASLDSCRIRQAAATIENRLRTG